MEWHRRVPTVALVVLSALFLAESVGANAWSVSSSSSTYSTAVVIRGDTRLPSATRQARAAARRGCTTGPYTWAHVLLLYGEGGFGWLDFECSRWRSAEAAEDLETGAPISALELSPMLTKARRRALEQDMPYEEAAQVLGGAGNLVIDAHPVGDRRFTSYVWVARGERWRIELLFIDDNLAWACTYSTVCME